jgi:membrane protease YdiL (CAAX protease family)
MATNDRELGFLWTFFALTYALSWVFWVPAALFGRDFTSTAWGIPYILGGFGPSVAGIIMVYRSAAKEERRDFWRRVVDFGRISAGWYLFIALIFPALFALSVLLTSLFDRPVPDFETLAQVAATPMILVGMVVIGIIAGPLSEELGWRGFALERLQNRRSPLASSLILAPFWWAWHLPLFFMSGTTQYKWGFGTPAFWLFLVGIVPLSVLLTWAYNRNNRSILAAILLHFTYNFTLSLVYPFSFTVNLLQVSLLLATAIGVVAADRAPQRLRLAEDA